VREEVIIITFLKAVAGRRTYSVKMMMMVEPAYNLLLHLHTALQEHTLTHRTERGRRSRVAMVLPVGLADRSSSSAPSTVSRDGPNLHKNPDGECSCR
jgi:hypothetical protein